MEPQINKAKLTRQHQYKSNLASNIKQTSQKWQQQLYFPRHHFTTQTRHYHSPAQTPSSSPPSQTPPPATSSLLLPPITSPPFRFIPAVHPSLFILVPAVALPPNQDRLSLPRILTRPASQVQLTDYYCSYNSSKIRPSSFISMLGFPSRRFEPKRRNSNSSVWVLWKFLEFDVQLVLLLYIGERRCSKLVIAILKSYNLQCLTRTLTRTLMVNGVSVDVQDGKKLSSAKI